MIAFVGAVFVVRATPAHPTELKMWYELRDQGKLSLAKTEEEEIFYATVEEHHEKEGSLARVQRWVCTFGSALLQSKLSAAIAKRRAARNN